MTDNMVKMTRSDEGEDELYRRLCHGLRMTPEELAQVSRCAGRVPGIEDHCRELFNRCSALEKLVKSSLCPANMNFSQLTVDRISNETQVNVTEFVTGLGGDYVNDYPVPPGKKIRLIQRSRPGYSPRDITVALNLANDGRNFLDLAIRLYVTTERGAIGEAVGPEFRGFQFFNTDGIPTPVAFPTYKNMPITIGTLEFLAVEIAHQGTSNNLVSAFVATAVNAAGWYAACGPSECG